MYCSLEDIQQRLSTDILLKLSDSDGDGLPDLAIIEAAIADADAEIDAYLGTRYVVPFTTPPAIVRQLSTVLAIANLFARLPGQGSAEQQQRTEQARQFLHFLATAELDITQAPETILRRFIASTTRDVTKIFSRQTLNIF